jgi:glycosyltransferase involved in cell wall biosynthesis
VVIPAFNEGPMVERSIRSVARSDYPADKLEIIVVDDGSRDDTLARARAHAGRHPRRLRVVAQANAGASAARNHALRLARGDFVQFLDADDLLAPDKIALQLARLAASAPDALASAEWARFHRAPAEARFAPEPVWRDLSGLEFQLLHYEAGWMMQPAAWLAPRALLDRSGPWDETLGLNDDGEYFSRVMLAASGIVFCPGARVYYRSGLAGSLSRQTSPRALKSLRRSTELNCSRLLAAAADSPRARAAAANGWQRLMLLAWPADPALSRDAERRRDALGGSPFPLPVGPAFTRLARLVGWRAAKRLRDLASGLRRRP